MNRFLVGPVGQHLRSLRPYRARGDKLQAPLVRMKAALMPNSQDGWASVPPEMRYLRPYVDKYGLLGRTVYRDDPLHSRSLSNRDIERLREAFLLIEQRKDFERIRQWCHSIEPMTDDVEITDPMIGLLILFDRFGEAGHEPFRRVKAIPEEPSPKFDWSKIPESLRDFVPYLKQYECLRSEEDIWIYLESASSVQRKEIHSLRTLLKIRGDDLRTWMKEYYDSDREAFQAGWLFLIEDFEKLN